MSVFHEEIRRFSVGDRIQLRSPANELNIANRELGVIREIDGGRLNLTMDSGRSIEIDPNKQPHLDYGYAMTGHSSQGQTADRVLIHVDTELAAKDLLNNRMAYVSVSRGAFDAQLFTNDRDKLPTALGHDVSKQTAEGLQINIEHTVTSQQEASSGWNSTVRVSELASKTAACPGWWQRSAGANSVKADQRSPLSRAPAWTEFARPAPRSLRHSGIGNERVYSPPTSKPLVLTPATPSLLTTSQAQTVKAVWPKHQCIVGGQAVTMFSVLIDICRCLDINENGVWKSKQSAQAPRPHNRDQFLSGLCLAVTLVLAN